MERLNSRILTTPETNASTILKKNCFGFPRHWAAQLAKK
jgi:hypothetical protein